MPKTTTAANITVPSADLIGIKSAHGLAIDSHLSEGEATAVWEIVESRTQNRNDGYEDVIITCEEWVTSFPEDEPISASRTILAGHIKDHSDKSYFLRGSVTVDESLLDAFLNDDEWQSNVINGIDESDGEYVDNRGEKYLPKSAVENIFVVEG